MLVCIISICTCHLRVCQLPLRRTRHDSENSDWCWSHTFPWSFLLRRLICFHCEDRVYFKYAAIIKHIFWDAFKKFPVYKTARIKYISCFVVFSCCWHKSVTQLYHPFDLRISIFKILSTLQKKKNHTSSRNCDNYNYTKMLITFTGAKHCVKFYL